MTGAHAIRVVRVYEQRSAVDDVRVLVDRIWPRGLSKDSADLDVWCKVNGLGASHATLLAEHLRSI